MVQRKYEAAKLIISKIKGETFMSYKEIADYTGYHEKYLLKLKKDIVDKKFNLEHRGKNKRANNRIDEKEEAYICDLYKRSHASIRAFSRFYSKRSYACIYNVLMRNGLLENESK